VIQIAIPISISRVNQFDAARLDVEMSAMLKEQLVKVFSLVKPGLLFQYEPELDAFLEFLIWRFSIWVDKPTPGNALMNLRYRDERAAPITGKEGICYFIVSQLLADLYNVYGTYFMALSLVAMLVIAPQSIRNVWIFLKCVPGDQDIYTLIVYHPCITIPLFTLVESRVMVKLHWFQIALV
jgi:hypothetical protein